MGAVFPGDLVSEVGDERQGPVVRIRPRLAAADGAVGEPVEEFPEALEGVGVEGLVAGDVLRREPFWA